MRLTDQQTSVLANRFDHLAMSIASALDFGSEESLRSTCDRLIALCRCAQRDEEPAGPNGNVARLMLHMLVALVAAIETRDDPEVAEAMARESTGAFARDRSWH
jgi:hypothetical protein